MTDLAWMKTYIGDEAALTGHLTAEEFGAYERLRRHYWQHGGLPLDDVRLMRITLVSPDRWGDVRSVICELFTDGWRLPKLDLDREDAAIKRERKVSAGRKGAAKRWSGTAEDGEPIGYAIPYGNTNGSAISDSEPNGYAMGNGTPNSKRMADPVAEPMRNQWPPAPALTPDEVRRDARLSPTRTHTREDTVDIPIDPPETMDEGRAYLQRRGVPASRIPSMLEMLMGHRLYPSSLDQVVAR